MHDAWRSGIESTLTHLVRDLATSPQFDLGLLATGVLWPIRTLIREDEAAAQSDLRPLVGDDVGAICTLVCTWPEDIHHAAAVTTQTAADSPAIKAALQRLVTAVNAAPLLSTTLFQQYATSPGAIFHGDITAALLNVGGTIAIGTLTIQLPDDPTARAKRHLDEATALLATLPIDEDLPIPAPAPLPTPNRMTLPPSPTFVGRDAELRQLATTLKTGTTAVVSAVTGIGGMGKTQLVSEFAHRYGPFFLGGVFWLSFAAAGGVEAEITACGGTMNLPSWDALDFPDQVQRILQLWNDPMPRLLIFDNCEDLALLDRYRPTTGGCRVLVTSRRDDWGTARHLPTLVLTLLPRAQSIALLRRFRPDLAENDPTLDALAAELGDLPLALHVAGSFLQRYPRQSLPDYLAQLRAAPINALTQRLERLAAAPTGHDLDVARTFRVSCNQLETSNPIDNLARALLARAACFAPGEPIPTEVLIQTLPDDTNMLDAEDALRRLGELGLLEEIDTAWRLHRLLATFTRVTVENMDAVQAAVEEGLIAYTEALNAQGYPARLQPLQSHLRYTIARLGKRKDEPAAQLLNAVAMYFQSIADYAAAQPLHKRALAIYESTLESNHPEIATSLNNLATLLSSQGHYAEARPLFERALNIRERSLGSTNELTIATLNNLAYLLYLQGDYSTAQPLFEHALMYGEQSLESTHPARISSLSHLAELHYRQGNDVMAQHLFEQVLAIRIQIYGLRHPDTAQSLNNLAVVFLSQQKYTNAQKLFEQVLQVTEDVFGSTHPYTAASLNNLADAYMSQGAYEKARLLCERALTIREQVLGPLHPNTAVSLNNLAHILQKQGNLTDAGLLYKRALAIQEQVLEPMHPSIAASLNNLAHLLQEQGHYVEARPLYVRALAICETNLPPNHPDTQTIRRNLATLS